MKYLMPMIQYAAIVMALAVPAASAARILLAGGYDDSSREFHAKLRQSIIRDGLDLEDVDPSILSSRLAGSKAGRSILILPDARRFPVDAKPALLEYLKAGNHLLAISGPAFGSLAVRTSDGRWMDRRQLKADLVNAKGQSFVDFETEDMTAWSRDSDIPESISRYTSAPSGNPGVPQAMHASIGKLSKWDMISRLISAHPFPDGFAGTAFWAKGGPDTPELAVEWKEKDGTRWTSVIRLSTSWKRYALLPEDFKFWDGPPARKETSFNPGNAERISFMLSEGITSQRTGIPHDYWVSEVRLIRDEYAGADFAPPILESLSPAYKTFVTRTRSIAPAGGRTPIAVQAEVVCPIPRPMGFGSDAVRAIRQIPVLNTLDADGEVTGIAAHLFLNTNSEYAGSIWGYVGFSQDWLNTHSELAMPHLMSMLHRIDTGVFLTNAGTDRFAYTVDEPVKCGAWIANLGPGPANASVEFSVTAKGKVLASAESDVIIAPGASQAPARVEGPRVSLPPGEYTIKTALTVGGANIDEIKYPFSVVKYPPLDSTNTVSVNGGDFYLAGRKWHPLGMNYFPRYSPAHETFIYWLRWLSPEQYNPYIVEQDLALAQKLGMNLLSISYIRPDESSALMDFMARAGRRGIKVNIYVPGVHPIWQDFETADAMINAAHLRQSSDLFAYDLGVEVRVGYYNERKSFDYRWHRWVMDRYGSIENASRDWGYQPLKDGVSITGPSDEQLLNDGIWRVYVAAYRRFWDDEISKGYRTVREHIKTMDKRHLLGAKSGWGGLGAVWVSPGFPFDLRSGAKHLDFISPEAYNVGGSAADFLRGGFNNTYGRYYSGGKPIFWSEFGPPVGVNIPAMKYTGYSSDMLEGQRSYYRKMFDMIYATSANGGVGWWWPAGYRVDEKSDFGIVGTDLTLRPSALEFPRMAARLINPREIYKPNVFLDVDRDKYVTGYAGVYNELAGRCAELLADGRSPGIRTRGIGTTSADTPAVAVGNAPYNGKNPPKFLNAEFNWLKINGNRVKDGDTVEIVRETSVRVDASIGNIAEAKWLAPAKAGVGAVFLTAEIGGTASLIPIAKDTPFMGDAFASGKISLPSVGGNAVCRIRMAARDRMNFGEVIGITFHIR